MRIIYTRKNFAAMPKSDKINIIRTETFEIPEPSFWEKLIEFKNKFMQKRA